MDGIDKTAAFNFKRCTLFSFRILKCDHHHWQSSVIMSRAVFAKELSTSECCRRLQAPFVCWNDRLQPSPSWCQCAEIYFWLIANVCSDWQDTTGTFLGWMVIYFQTRANRNLSKWSMNSRPITPPLFTYLSLLHLASVSGVPLSLPSHYLIAGSFNWLFDSWDF